MPWHEQQVDSGGRRSQSKLELPCVRISYRSREKCNERTERYPKIEIEKNQKEKKRNVPCLHVPNSPTLAVGYIDKPDIRGGSPNMPAGCRCWLGTYGRKQRTQKHANVATSVVVALVGSACERVKP